MNLNVQVINLQIWPNHLEIAVTYYIHPFKCPPPPLQHWKGQSSGFMSSSIASTFAIQGVSKKDTFLWIPNKVSPNRKKRKLKQNIAVLIKNALKSTKILDVINIFLQI